jgi:Mobilization protein NikA
MSKSEKAAKAKQSGSETRQRTKRLTVRFTAAELAEIEGAAARAGLAIGSHVRAVLLTGPAPRAVRSPSVDRKALAQALAFLGRLGSNVNQIARVLNYGERHDPPALDRALSEITELRNMLMAALGRPAANENERQPAAV